MADEVKSKIIMKSWDELYQLVASEIGEEDPEDDEVDDILKKNEEEIGGNSSK